MEPANLSLKSGAETSDPAVIQTNTTCRVSWRGPAFRVLTWLNAGCTKYFKANCGLRVLNHNDRRLKKNLNKHDIGKISG
jgi:hypothetical protein